MIRRPARHAASLYVVALCLSALGTAGAVLPVRAAAPAVRTLDAAHPMVVWDGRYTDPTTTGFGLPAEQTCTPQTCDTVRVDIELPAGTFPKPTDGVLVSIKWATDYDQWNLYVDGPDGTTLAQGIDVDSNAQSVLIPQPRNGVYTIKAVPFYTTFVPGDLTYRGIAETYLDPTARVAPGTVLLPQLQTVSPSEFSISGVPPIPSNPTGWRWTSQQAMSNSCYLDETLTYGSTRCLRFSNDIRNLGPGPMTLRFRYDRNWVTACLMQQEIEVIGGTPIDRDAGPCIFHPQHAHFHYQNFAVYQLYAVGQDGLPSASSLLRSNKVGFCTVDVDDYSFGAPSSNQRPRHYTFPTCNVPNNIPTNNPAVWEYMGISPGWGDVYTWDLPVQYIDVTSVPDGVYEVVSRANPDGALMEAATGKETGVACIRLSGNSVKVLQTFPSQSNSAPLPACVAAAAAASTSTPGPEASAPSGGAAAQAIPNTTAGAGDQGVLALASGVLTVLASIARRRRRSRG
jgi:hypothetical protein